MVQKRTHPAVPDVKESSKIVPHVGVVIVVVGDIVHSSKQPMTRQPFWNHFVPGVPRNIDHRIIREIGQQNDRFERNKDNNQH